jgi:alpha-tubulin suppressor-like RCC1 family protein
MSGGAKKQLAWILKDAFGNVITGRTVTFLSSNPSLATVSSGGEVTAAPGDGSVVITATVEGKSAAATIDIVTFVRMSAGSNFTCALNTEGTAYCWGDNFNGQLGNGGSANSNVPTKVSTNLKFVAITSGQAHTCAITSAGVAYCWGDNSWGQLGAGTVGQASRVPQAVGGGYTFNSIAGGKNSTCGSTPSLEVYCWGQTFPTGQFGPVQLAPRLVGSGMVAVVGGPTTNKYCSVDQGALGYCWTPDFASASSNQMGTAVSASLRFSTLRVALTHVCGVATTGQAYCWGENFAGQLGDGTTTARNDPTLVSGGLVFESVAVGSGGFVDVNGSTRGAGYSCGVTTGGKGYCWGMNGSGQLGTDGSPATFTTPQPVAGSLSFTGLRAAANHTCGLATNGPAYCWGANSVGQLGDGTATDKPAPSPVFGN